MNRALLLSTTAPIRPWDGEPRIFWRIEELRAMGIGWDEIEQIAFTNAVQWDEGERDDGRLAY